MRSNFHKKDLLSKNLAGNSGHCVGPGLYAFGAEYIDIPLWKNFVLDILRFCQSMTHRKVLTKIQWKIMIFHTVFLGAQEERLLGLGCANVTQYDYFQA